MPNPNELYDKVLELSAKDPDDFVALGHALRQLRERDSVLFNQAIGKIGLSPRKARDLVKFSPSFASLQSTPAHLRAIGFPKLQIIAPHLTDDNIDQMLELAENYAIAELKTLLKGDGPATNVKGVTMYFGPEEFRTFEEVLLKHGALRSGKRLLKKEEALLRLIAEAKHSPAVDSGDLSASPQSAAGELNIVRLMVRATGKTPWTDVQHWELMKKVNSMLFKLWANHLLNDDSWQRDDQRLTGIMVHRANPPIPSDGYRAAEQGFLLEENPFEVGAQQHAAWIKAYKRPNIRNIR